MALDTLITDLEKAVARGSFHPVVPVVGTSELGMVELLEVIVRGFPSPLEHRLPTVTTPDGEAREPISCDVDGPLVAEVVKTTTDPYVGRLSIVRVFSGKVVPDATVHVSGHFARFVDDDQRSAGHPDHDVDERLGAISHLLGATLSPIDAGVAGDVVAIARLSKAETGDTLSDPEAPALMEPWTMPEPLLPTALVARSSTDDDKLMQGLARLVAEDPTVRVEVDPATHQMVVWSMGESHLEVLTDKLRYAARSRAGQRAGPGGAAGDDAQGRAPGMAGTSSSPAGTASTRSATSRWSRCRRDRVSSSSTRWSAGRCRASSSRRSRRGCGHRWTRGSPPATRWSTCG